MEMARSRGVTAPATLANLQEIRRKVRVSINGLTVDAMMATGSMVSSMDTVFTKIKEASRKRAAGRTEKLSNGSDKIKPSLLSNSKLACNNLPHPLKTSTQLGYPGTRIENSAEARHPVLTMMSDDRLIL